MLSLQNFDCAFFFFFGDERKDTLKRMENFCLASNIGVFGRELKPKSCGLTGVRRYFTEVMDAIEENGLQCFLIVKSVDSLLIGFKEMDRLAQMVERGGIAVWCLDERALLVNSEKTIL